MSTRIYLARLTHLTKIKDTKDYTRLSIKGSWLDSHLFAKKLRLKGEPFLKASY